MTEEFLFYFRFEMLDLRFEIVERMRLSQISLFSTNQFSISILTSQISILIRLLSQYSNLKSHIYLIQTR
ncbi:hypothetical protein HNP72_002824 [Sphingobacterium soli]|nr:hypothetical protein [Sphingobacterium soli]